MPDVLIALGSNVGNRLRNLQSSIDLLRGRVGVLRVSPVYETDPMYVEDQPKFLNAALVGEVHVSPRGLLRALKETEEQVGRLLRGRYGPREVDLDLIAYGSLAYRYEESKSVRLEIPHPRLGERRFVLTPLADVAPDFCVPGLGPVATLLRQTEGQSASVTRKEDAVLSI